MGGSENPLEPPLQRIKLWGQLIHGRYHAYGRNQFSPEADESGQCETKEPD